MKRALVVALAIASAGAGAPVRALSPSEVFEKVAPSVWAVRPLDGAGRPINYGSGVVIGAGRMVTNCHVLIRAKAVQVRREKLSFEAALEHADPERDLCTLTVKDFTAPAAAIGSFAALKIGQRVYTVGNPEGLALTLAEGLISGLRTEDPRLPPIQTTAPISPGSSGGGLFDEQGRLLGITTSAVVGRQRIAQNLNFAMPAEWIAEVPERAKAALAARKTAPASPGTGAGVPASAALPVAGATYRYQWTEKQYSGRTLEFTVRITNVDGWTVTDSFAAGGNSTPVSSQVPAREPRFRARRLADGLSLEEFAPYLPMPAQGELPHPGPPSNYGGNTDGSWSIAVESRGWEQVSVPSGTYRALRVDLRGSRPTSGLSLIATAKFEYTAWYVPELGRYVKIRHQCWNGRNSSIADEQVELLEYRPN
jgi:hypothetical protein